MFSSPARPQKKLTLAAVCLGTFMLVTTLALLAQTFHGAERTAVAALGSVYAARMRHATAATLTAHYASSLNVLLLITACLALAAAALAIVLIRRRDFGPSQPAAEPARTGMPLAERK